VDALRCSDELIAAAATELAAVLPGERLVTRGMRLSRYHRDASTAIGGTQLAVKAASVEDVRAVLRIAHELTLPVYTRGLGSGLSGGAVPSCGGIVLDMAALDALLEVRPGNRSCRVQPGMSVERLNLCVAEYGLWYPPWPSSHDISSIGGNIAMDAGGITTVKYGTTSDWVLGLTAVLPGGELLRCGSAAVKDVAGFDLTRLLCGSEGLLAVIVEATLRLEPLPGGIGTAVFSFATDAAAAQAAEGVLVGPLTPRTLEFIDAATLSAVFDYLGDAAHSVFPEAGDLPAGGALLCVETDSSSLQDALAQLEGVARQLRGAGGTCLGLTSDREAALRLWRVRAALSPACFTRGSYKLAEDVAVPRDRLVVFIEGLHAIGRTAGLSFLNYGHIGDGNFHCTLMFDGENDPRLPAGLAAVEAVYRLAVELGGTITGEHGIGLLKAPHIGLQLDPVALGLMHGIKGVFDPRGILNPGKWL
jgi:glycolate oxidase subunit GlcD